MKAESLRFGNLIEYTSPIDDKSQVVSVNIYHLADISGLSALSDIERKNAYSPIPLTEEWLLKLGFVKTKVPMKSDIEYIDFRMGQFVLLMWPSGEVEVEFCASHNSIEERGYLLAVKYVHQLQNLYFALTGEELEVKP